MTRLLCRAPIPLWDAPLPLWSRLPSLSPLAVLFLCSIRASLIAQLVKNLPATQETPVWFPGPGRSNGEGIGYPLQYSWASLVAQLVKNLLAIGRPGFYPWVGKIPWRRERLPTPVFWPGEFHGPSPWGRKESDTTEWLSSSSILYWGCYTLMFPVLAASITYLLLHGLIDSCDCGSSPGWELPKACSQSRRLLWAPGLATQPPAGLPFRFFTETWHA